MSKIDVIACDPGQTGSFCLLRLDSTQQPKIFFIENANPLNEIQAWLADATTNLNIRMLMVEEVHSVFGASAKANFTFGRNVGVVNTLLDLLPIGKDIVQPKEWQKFCGIPAKKKGQKRSTADVKKLVAVAADRLYPGCDIRTPRGRILDGRADALMIAHFCAHKYK